MGVILDASGSGVAVSQKPAGLIIRREPSDAYGIQVAWLSGLSPYFVRSNANLFVVY